MDMMMMHMQKAYWLATIFGPFLVILGVWMLGYKENLMKTYSSIKGTPSVMYLRSIINMLVGLTIIREYNLWIANMAILVTLLGWAMLIRGIITLFAPQFCISIGMSDQKVIQARGFIPLVWGLLLLWFVFA